MKKALSLVEVLISVMLISVVIASILQIKQNNLHFLDKSKESAKNDAYISMVSLVDEKGFRNKNIRLTDVVNFNDDDIRKELKEIKIKVKDEELDPLEFTTDEYTLIVNIKQTNLTIDDKVQKSFYRFSLDN